MSKVYKNVAAVIIGRNEGERLVRCLNTLINYTDKIVYVDSASTDSSIEEAQKKRRTCYCAGYGNAIYGCKSQKCGF